MSRGRLNRWIVRQWRAPTVLGQGALRPASALFRALVALRRSAYRLGLRRAAHLPVPVVVVGNITVGGSGKTPLVMHLVEQLQAHGWHPGVVSRGYQSATSSPRRIGADADPVENGDEPVMVAQRCRCPVAVGAERPAAARLLLPDCDVIVSDDGLQHYALTRDLEIAVVDGDAGLGNGRMLPTGPLREPRGRLRSVDFVAVRDDDGVFDAAAYEAYAFRVAVGLTRRLVAPEVTRPLDAWGDSPVHAVAGIGVPERFFGQLEDLGLDVERHAFADHHAFRPADLAFGDQAPILMTEKDAIKCRAFADERAWFVSAAVIDDDGLAQTVIRRLGARGPATEEDNGPAAA